MAFRDLKLGTKQGLGFGFILVVMAGVSLFAITELGALRKEIDDINTIWLRRAVVVSRLNINASALRTSQMQHAFAAGAARKQAYVGTMLALIDSINADWDAYSTLKEETSRRNLFMPEEEALSDSLEALWDRYLGQSLEYLGLFDENRNREAIELLDGAAGAVFADFSGALDVLVSINEARAAEAAQRAESTYRTTRNRIIALLIATILLSGLLAARLVRFITIPVQQLVRAARKVAEGDFSARPEIPSQDEIGKLARSFNRMTASLEAQQEALRATNAELADKSRSLERQKTEIEQKNHDLEDALRQLQQTQQQLLMKEKMASLGALTAGIAHEIKNPLNFVNNFSQLSGELTEELEEILQAHHAALPDDVGQEVEEILTDLRFNAHKIAEHGRRADGIVRSMLEHSRSQPGRRLATDVNALIEEYVGLAYHGMRAQHPDFVVTLERAYDDAAGTLDLVPQEIGLVLLNLINNAFYAVHKRRKERGDPYAPTVWVITRKAGEALEIRIEDNGPGVDEALRHKIFEPFFTTKPTGEGTGLGLSLSYDIITQGYGGALTLESRDGEGASFVVTLPA